jgi:hypothetical protein
MRLWWKQEVSKELEMPGFWKAGSVEGSWLERREAWVYRRRRFEMLTVFGLEASRILEADGSGLLEQRSSI